MKSTRLIKRIKRVGENINVRGGRIKRSYPSDLWRYIYARVRALLSDTRRAIIFIRRPWHFFPDHPPHRFRPTYFLIGVRTNRHGVLRPTLSHDDRSSHARWFLLATINSSPDNKVSLRLALENAQVNFSTCRKRAAGERFASDSVQRNEQRYPTLWKAATCVCNNNRGERTWNKEEKNDEIVYPRKEWTVESALNTH